MTAAIVAGFVLGIAGSAHCAAMCGPLVATFAPHGMRAVLHHLGRFAVYIAIGVTAGVAGSAIAWAGFGQVVALAAAIVLICQALMRSGAVPLPARFNARPRWLSNMLSRVVGWSRAHRVAGPLLIGGVNGLLPCGLVHAAAAAAAGLATPRDGALLMAAFGLGTVPVLAASGVFAAALARRRFWARYSPALMMAVALLLILRATSVAHAH
jgi:sulfite exporter TauE/SafE